MSLYAQNHQVGALTMYSRHDGRFATREEIDVSLIFALHVADVVASTHLINGLETATSSRQIISAAQGVLMERYGLSWEQTFDLLRRISSHEDIKISGLARHIVTTGRVQTLDHAPAEK